MNVKLAAGCVALILAGGCANYYKVIDPTSGKTYYTNQVDRQGSGATSFKDARTGNDVTLQNTEVDQISKEEFETARSQPEKPAPAPAPAPAPGAAAPAPAAPTATANPFQ